MAGQDDWRKAVREWLLVGMAEEALTQGSLATLTGISQQQISKYCLGKDLPGDQNIALIEQALQRTAPRMLLLPSSTTSKDLSEEGAAPLHPRDLLLQIYDVLSPQRQEQLLDAARAMRDLGP